MGSTPERRGPHAGQDRTPCGSRATGPNRAPTVRIPSHARGRVGCSEAPARYAFGVDPAKESAPELHDPVQTLRVTPLHHSGCVAIYDVRCRPSDFARGPEEWSLTHQIVFPRRGVFVH